MKQGRPRKINKNYHLNVICLAESLGCGAKLEEIGHHGGP